MTAAFNAPGHPGLDLVGLTLVAGDHESPAAGGCVMETVSVVAGEAWSAAPVCVSPVIRRFLARWNDTLPTAGRQCLKRHIHPVIGTATTGADERRREWLVCDWLVRESTPAWLGAAGRPDLAGALAALPAVVPATMAGARPTLRSARAALVCAARGADPAAVAALAGVSGWAAARAVLDAADWLDEPDPDRRLVLDVALLAIAAASPGAPWEVAGRVHDSAHRLVERLVAMGRRPAPGERS